MRPMMWSHGNQEDRFFHGYYDHYCFLPLYVFFIAASSYWSVTCARARSTAPSMPGRSWLCWLNDCDRSGHKSELSSVATPVFVSRWRMLLWCERNNVGYIVGIAKNKRLKRPHRTAATRCTRLLCRIGCQGALCLLISTTQPAVGIASGGSSPRSNTRLRQ